MKSWGRHGAGAAQRVTISATIVSSVLKYYHFYSGNEANRAALSFATQHALPQEFDKKWGMEVLTLCSYVVPTYPFMHIQREAKKLYVIKLKKLN